MNEYRTRSSEPDRVPSVASMGWACHSEHRNTLDSTHNVRGRGGDIVIDDNGQRPGMSLRCATGAFFSGRFVFHCVPHAGGDRPIWSNLPLSRSTQKKELVGDFKNAERELRPKASPEDVRVHDFIDRDLGRAVPYRIYQPVEEVMSRDHRF